MFQIWSLSYTVEIYALVDNERTLTVHTVCKVIDDKQIRSTDKRDLERVNGRFIK